MCSSGFCFCVGLYVNMTLFVAWFDFSVLVVCTTYGKLLKSLHEIWLWHSEKLAHDHCRRTRRGWWWQPPGLKTFRANSVFRASASCSKFLNDKNYFNTVKNFRANFVFQGKSKLLKNVRWQKIYSVQWIHATACYSGQAQVAQNSGMLKIYSMQWKIPRQTLFFRASAMLLKNHERWKNC